MINISGPYDMYYGMRSEKRLFDICNFINPATGTITSFNIEIMFCLKIKKHK
jgi:hypothetical protein